MFLNASGPSEPDQHLPIVDDDGHAPLPPRMLEHKLQVHVVLLHVDVPKIHLALGVVLTGRLRIGSTIFPKDQHHMSDST